MDTLRAVFRAVGAGFDGEVLWRGPSLDRLVDARHAALVDFAARRLLRLGWTCLPEVSYSEFGERGSIDLLGSRADRKAVVVEEVKSDLTRIEETLRKLDEKVRLVARAIAYDRLGWRPNVIGRVLVLPDTDRARRQVAAHAATFDAAFSARGPEVRAWLKDPIGPLSGVLFVADITPDGSNAARPGAQRVRVKPGARSVANTAPADLGYSQRLRARVALTPLMSAMGAAIRPRTARHRPAAPGARYSSSAAAAASAAPAMPRGSLPFGQ